MPAGQASGSGIEPAEQIEHCQKKGDADQQALDTVEGLARPAVTFAGRDGPVHEASLRDRFGLQPPWLTAYALSTMLAPICLDAHPQECLSETRKSPTPSGVFGDTRARGYPGSNRSGGLKRGDRNYSPIGSQEEAPPERGLGPGSPSVKSIAGFRKGLHSKVASLSPSRR